MPVTLEELEKGLPRMLTYPREVRMKVLGWKHYALDHLGDAYPDSLFRNQILPKYTRVWGAKSLEGLLRYGLINRIAFGRYVIKRAGLKVLKQLDAIRVVPEPEITTYMPDTHARDQFFDEEGHMYWVNYEKIVGMTPGKQGYPSGYRMIIVKVPGSFKWEKYFSTRTW